MWYTTKSLFKYIQSDDDARRLNTRYGVVSKKTHVLFAFFGLSLVAWFMIGSILQFTHIFHPNVDLMCAISLALLVITCITGGIASYYEDMYKYTLPLAQTNECLDLDLIISKYSVARTLRDNIISSGRQLYFIDLAILKQATQYMTVDISSHELDHVCKRVHQIS